MRNADCGRRDRTAAQTDHGADRPDADGGGRGGISADRSTGKGLCQREDAYAGGAGSCGTDSVLFPAQAGCTAGTAGRSGNHGDHGKRCRTYLLRESGTAVQSGVRVFLQRKVK